MRGRAVPTTVWSKEARNRVSRIAPRIVNFARGGSDISDGAAVLGSVEGCAPAGRRELIGSLPKSVHSRPAPALPQRGLQDSRRRSPQGEQSVLPRGRRRPLRGAPRPTEQLATSR